MTSLVDISEKPPTWLLALSLLPSLKVCALNPTLLGISSTSMGQCDETQAGTFNAHFFRSLSPLPPVFEEKQPLENIPIQKKLLQKNITKMLQKIETILGVKMDPWYFFEAAMGHVTSLIETVTQQNMAFGRKEAILLWAIHYSYGHFLPSDLAHNTHNLLLNALLLCAYRKDYAQLCQLRKNSLYRILLSKETLLEAYAHLIAHPSKIITTHIDILFCAYIGALPSLEYKISTAAPHQKALFTSGYNDVVLLTIGLAIEKSHLALAQYLIEQNHHKPIAKKLKLSDFCTKFVRVIIENNDHNMFCVFLQGFSEHLTKKSLLLLCELAMAKNRPAIVQILFQIYRDHFSLEARLKLFYWASHHTFFQEPQHLLLSKNNRCVTLFTLSSFCKAFSLSQEKEFYCDLTAKKLLAQPLFLSHMLEWSICAKEIHSIRAFLSRFQEHCLLHSNAQQLHIIKQYLSHLFIVIGNLSLSALRLPLLQEIHPAFIEKKVVHHFLTVGSTAPADILENLYQKFELSPPPQPDVNLYTFQTPPITASISPLKRDTPLEGASFPETKRRKLC